MPTPISLRSAGRAVRAELDGVPVPLILNDRVHLYDATGVHIGQHDMDVRAARNLLPRTAYLGLSVQTLEHVKASRRFPSGLIDYLGVGPVWAQQTELDAASPTGKQMPAAIVGTSPWPCVAIICGNASRAPAVRRPGAAGMAVVNAICGQVDIHAATPTLRHAWQEG